MDVVGSWMDGGTGVLCGKRQVRNGEMIVSCKLRHSFSLTAQLYLLDHGWGAAASLVCAH